VDAGNRLAASSGNQALLSETFDAAEQDRLWSLRALVPDASDWRSRLPARYWELLARFQSEGDADAALETYRRKIVEQFFPAYGHAQSKLAVARKAIRDYCKAAQNLAGKIEMMLTYVENGTEFTRTLMQEGSALYPRFRERVQRLATRGGRIGWGYGDTLVDQVGLLEKELAGQ